MVNLLKKSFIYLTLVLLALVSFSVESASAAEAVDYEEGVTNLNNTPENSAVIGNQLLKPEKGWKRYDDSNPIIKYVGSWNLASGNSDYNKTQHYTTYSTQAAIDSNYNFNFKGTKLRIISPTWNTSSSKIEVMIDGEIIETYSAYSNKQQRQTLIYEKIGLEDKIHEVIIKNKTTSYLILDAIDIDGELINIDSTESITLDRNVLELLEGSQDKLTATVTPDTAKVIWSSSDKSIATVDQDGNVTALHEGEAIITAKIEGTDITATSTVIVKKPNNEFSSAILSITLVNGITKEYDVTNTVLNNYLNWFESAQGTSTFKFSKTISPYKKVTEYIVHDKIASFEVREY
ncbi:Ig-like domain-containing protein [Lysinibacillus fusiformis]|uniref:Ig-like domain-containing protein n=1 Tax=Lysinibacillus fusiformis TaxID=28031 RepID=UPI002D7853B5|nr:Ig-like domain-containing protein [Lysinibacillus fusiformis]WRS99951.1 Ig-like domain-containing protein [Lysinibacillus fusiformis]